MWILEHVEVVRGGRLPRPLRDYHPLVADALLNKIADELQAAQSRYEEEEAKALASYDGPLLTGDPLADEWERAIARGEEPDW